MIRYGEYSRIKGYDFKLSEARQEAPIPFTHFILSWENEINCPIDGFEKDKHGSIIKIVEKNKVENAFRISTKAIYKGQEFLVYPYKADLSCYELSTKDEKLAKELNFVKLTDSYGKPYYIDAIKKIEIEKLWEERSESQFNLPFPDGLNLIQEIEIS